MHCQVHALSGSLRKAFFESLLTRWVIIDLQTIRVTRKCLSFGRAAEGQDCPKCVVVGKSVSEYASECVCECASECVWAYCECVCVSVCVSVCVYCVFTVIKWTIGELQADVDFKERCVFKQSHRVLCYDHGLDLSRRSSTLSEEHLLSVQTEWSLVLTVLAVHSNYMCIVLKAHIVGIMVMDLLYILANQCFVHLCQSTIHLFSP